MPTGYSETEPTFLITGVLASPCPYRTWGRSHYPICSSKLRTLTHRIATRTGTRPPQPPNPAPCPYRTPGRSHYPICSSKFMIAPHIHLLKVARSQTPRKATTKVPRFPAPHRHRPCLPMTRRLPHGRGVIGKAGVEQMRDPCGRPGGGHTHFPSKKM